MEIILKSTIMPKHVAIIMDGNGRWAKMRGLTRSEGHKRGVERLREILESAKEAGVGTLSVYAFSLENWMRPEEEINVIMNLLETALKNDFLTFMKEGVRFKAIGNRQRLSREIVSVIEAVEEQTAGNKEIVLQCALSYGGRDEIIRAVKKLIAAGTEPDAITEESLSPMFDTSGTPDPDLIIRTSGEQRISNFLLWQSAYSEFYFTDTLWPDFTKEEFLQAIHEYQSRNRRFGNIGTSEELSAMIERP
ncbi:MAG: isoprenyl transferase [Dissulfurispiraceae bacterium]|jgi:undecaprenyl diphosphate synthase|nr:isoprenyl transferase [Dissulfurispiraceae bacterium]